LPDTNLSGFYLGNLLPLPLIRGANNNQRLRTRRRSDRKVCRIEGVIHGIGAETGTQVLIIATAVGAGSKITGVAALLAFVVGLLISNSIVTVMSTFGFVSTRRKQWMYVGVGMIAAVFSLALGVIFLLQSGGSLPDLGGYFRWIGGPE
jgi:high-affinity nickel-transport protein